MMMYECMRDTSKIGRETGQIGDWARERERDNLGIKVKMFEEEARVRLFGSLSLVECVFGWSWLYETQSYCPIISSRVAMTMRSFMLHYS